MNGAIKLLSLIIVIFKILKNNYKKYVQKLSNKKIKFSNYQDICERTLLVVCVYKIQVDKLKNDQLMAF